jgi:predicted NACHT family NTPase
VVHHQDRNLPRRRADLYAKCVRVLVEHWRKEMRELQKVSGFDPEAAEGVLSTVAWWLHGQESRTSQTVEELGAVATKSLADLAPGAGLGRDGVEFIRRMRDESGILAMWGAGQCGFLHLTFQEYLAGFHAAREGLAEALVQHVGTSWWREVILVAVAVGSRDFARKFFAALV